MTPPFPAHASVALDDVQGLLRFGYKHHVEAVFLLLRVADREAARAWLAAVPVNSAATTEPLPATVLQLALTCDGLAALGVPHDITARFSAEFVDGMAGDPGRSRRLGDVGANAPAEWRWGTGHTAPHVLLMLYALPGQLAAHQAAVEAGCARAFSLLARWPCGRLRGVEHFGFADGISQPELDWARERPAVDTEQAACQPLACLGEFLLGYPNEYGGWTDRPLLSEERDRLGLLPRAEDQPAMADLGRNGSYLVLRQLQQDVAGFWQWLDREAGGDPQAREALAARMVGRQRDGTPLAQGPHPPPESGAVDLNDFDFNGDPRGLRCPLGAHVRRANPRSADLPPPGSSGRPGLPAPLSWLQRTLGFDREALDRDLVASTRFHRLLRRGREYGRPLTPDEALHGDAAADETGLFFVCLNASIARQFEFVQGAWLASTRFNGLRGESDPLLGTREVTPDGLKSDTFSVPQALGADQRLCGLPQFVTLRGGAYFFMPGIRALRYLAQVR
ncbi:MAG: hypothetical protein JWQ88_2522 [Rhodoferax sp.]|nr:hypothetical protein [Rhodoferax sp.]